MIAVSCIFALLGADEIVAGGNGSFEVELSRKPNLRKARESQQPQGQQQTPGNVRLASTKSHRSLKDAEETTPPETPETESENEEPENETEEPEDTEENNDGDSNDKTGDSEEKESASTTEEATEVENTETEEEEKEEADTQQQTEPPVPDTAAPVEPSPEKPTAKPTAKPYTPNSDEFDPVKAEDEKHAEEEEVQELETELKQEEKVARQAGGLGIFFGILAMIFTAHQMSENPDGIYASVCRLAITISSVIVKIVCMPCRKLMGTGNGNPYSGHMPISTSDYTYRNDPYRSNANAGFEMS